MLIDCNDIVGTRISVFDVLECINPECKERLKLRYRVKCIKCGYEKIVSRSFLHGARCHKPTSCEKCIPKNNKYKNESGKIINDRYIVVGKFIKGPRITYIVKCTKCNKLLCLTSAKIHRPNGNNMYCSHKAYFRMEDYNEKDYVLFENINNGKKENIMSLQNINNYKEGDIYGTFTIIRELDKKKNNRRFLVKCNTCGTESEVGIAALLYSKKVNSTHCRKCNESSFKKIKAVKNNISVNTTKIYNINNHIDDNVIKLVNARFSKYAISENKQVITDRINHIINNSDLFKKALLDNAAKYIEENFEDDPFSVNEYIKLLINEEDFETKGLLRGGTIVEKVVEVPVNSEPIEAPVELVEIEKKVPVYDTLTSPNQLYKRNDDVFTSEHHVINIIEQNKLYMAGHYLVHGNKYYIDDYGEEKLVDIAINKKNKTDIKDPSPNSAAIMNVLMDKANKIDTDNLKNNVLLTDPIFQSMVKVASNQKTKNNSAKKKFINGNKELINSVNAFRCFAQTMSDYNVKSSSLSEFNEYCERNDEIGFNENPRYYSYLDRLNNEILNLRSNDFNNAINKFYGKNNIKTNIDTVKKIWISKKFLIRDNKTRKFESNNRVNINASELRTFIVKNLDCLNYAMQEYK